MPSEYAENSDAVSVGGGWIGIYQFQSLCSLLAPVRFEATFRMSDSGFAGQILDDAILGLADVEGRQTGRYVEFTKTYVSAPIERSRISEYSGQLSEDGRTMRGTWRIKAPKSIIKIFGVHGTWTARRMWNEESAQNERDEVEPMAYIGRELADAK